MPWGPTSARVDPRASMACAGARVHGQDAGPGAQACPQHRGSPMFSALPQMEDPHPHNRARPTGTAVRWHPTCPRCSSAFQVFCRHHTIFTDPHISMPSAAHSCLAIKMKPDSRDARTGQRARRKAEHAANKATAC